MELVLGVGLPWDTDLFYSKVRDGKINVELPIDLKYILCRDWDNIVNKKRLFTIPAKVTNRCFSTKFVQKNVFLSFTVERYFSILTCLQIIQSKYIQKNIMVTFYVKKMMLCGKKIKRIGIKKQFFHLFWCFLAENSIIFFQFSKKKLLLITKFLQLYDM